MGIVAYEFPDTHQLQWLEHEVSPPKDLTSFTIIFQTYGRYQSRPWQIACYGDEGDECRLSVVVNVNYTMEVIIESTR